MLGIEVCGLYGVLWFYWAFSSRIRLKRIRLEQRQGGWVRAVRHDALPALGDRPDAPDTVDGQGARTCRPMKGNPWLPARRADNSERAGTDGIESPAAVPTNNDGLLQHSHRAPLPDLKALTWYELSDSLIAAQTVCLTFQSPDGRLRCGRARSAAGPLPVRRGLFPNSRRWTDRCCSTEPAPLQGRGPGAGPRVGTDS